LTEKKGPGRPRQHRVPLDEQANYVRGDGKIVRLTAIRLTEDERQWLEKAGGISRTVKKLIKYAQWEEEGRVVSRAVSVYEQDRCGECGRMKARGKRGKKHG
jgi:hypothetical protein